MKNLILIGSASALLYGLLSGRIGGLQAFTASIFLTVIWVGVEVISSILRDQDEQR